MSSLTGKKFIVGHGGSSLSVSMSGYKSNNRKTRFYNSIEEIITLSNGMPIEIYEVEIKPPKWYQRKINFEEIEPPTKMNPEMCDED